MPTADDLQLDTHPTLAEAASRLFYSAATVPDAATFVARSLPTVCTAVGAEFAAIVRGEKGEWQKIGSAGKNQPLATVVLTEALDQEMMCVRGEWAAIPLPKRREAGELLLVFRARKQALAVGGELPLLAMWLGQGLTTVHARVQDRQRCERLQAMLEIAARWHETLEMEPLLQQMAEASTKLLQAERATIFLWDRGTKTLIGRPALGVEGGELRVPDNAGIVGHVVQTGENRRVDFDIAAEQLEIDRRVDKKLKYQTRTILCVPLVAKNGDCCGAFEVLNKRGGNFTREDEASLVELAQHASRALENTKQFTALIQAQSQAANEAAARVQLLGECPAIKSLRATVERVAASDLAVLILGENGTGKEVVSQMIHYHSKRRNETLVAVNCAAIPDTLLESELFGHEKGAFTDAREARAGKFELAANGTLFLDEIGDMSLSGQAKLLRVLEEKIVVRVGGSRPISTDARVIAATNQNLGELVRARKFREDLFFRLNVVSLELPPLRDRGDDVLVLAEHFLQIFSRRSRRKAPKLTAAAKKKLGEHSWPGNIRELRNMMERVAFLLPEDQDRLDGADLQFILAPEGNAAEVLSLNATLNDASRRFQIEYIRRQITSARGNMTLAAERLGLHRSNLYRKMGQLGMETGDGE